MDEQKNNLNEIVDVPEKRDYEQELLLLLTQNNSIKTLKELLDDYHENDIAAVLPSLTKEQRIKLYKALGVDRVSDVFAYLDDVEEFIEELDVEKVADILENMDADDAIDVLEELDEDKKEEIIIKKFCRYHANSYLCMQNNTIRHIIRYEEKKSIGSRNTLCLCRIPG